jgi:hypothetical protein
VLRENRSFHGYGADVPSTSFETWTKERLARLDQLASAHALISRPAPGKRVRVQAINWALVVLLSAELQGYFRDLHTESAEFIAGRMAGGSFAHFTLIRNGLTLERGLDLRNPTHKVVKDSFIRLGVPDLWADIDALVVKSGSRWRQQLQRLNTARNGVAHYDTEKLATLESQGFPLHLRTINGWRAACQGIVRNADKVVGNRLAQTTGARPW